MTDLVLNDQEQGWLAGVAGPAMQLAMQVMKSAAVVSQATEFVPIEFAHIGAGFYSGQVSVDFAEFLLANDASFAVPTHTNVSLIDCATPELRPAAEFPTEVSGATRLMHIYEQLGAAPMWSCAPYAEPAGRPAFGSQIVGSESNAVSFFNSALGARTNKYGDFLDVCAAMIGRVPLAGLHTDRGRRATQVFDVTSLPESTLADPVFPHLLGIVLGEQTGAAIPVVVGMCSASEDALKAIAAAGATSGAVEMFHIVGVTPEATTLDDATGGEPPARTFHVTATAVASARARLSTAQTLPLRAVCLGTPHFTTTEFGDLRSALAGRSVSAKVKLLVTTSRAVHLELGLRGWLAEFDDAGVTIALDTCTYYAPAVRGVDDLVMTNSAKWAYYAPGILGVEVAFGSLQACVESAVAGRVVG